MDIKVNGVSFNRAVIENAKSAESLAKSLPNVFKGHEKREEMFKKLFDSVHGVKKSPEKKGKK